MYIDEKKTYELHMSSEDLNNFRIMLDNYVETEDMSGVIKKFYDSLRDVVIEFV